MVQFLFRRSGSSSAPRELIAQSPQKRGTQWTSRLAALVDDEEGGRQSSGPVVRKSNTSNPSPEETGHNSNHEVSTSVRLEGPYFTYANPEAYKTVICLVAGTGLSGAIAIAAAFKAQQSRIRSACSASATTVGRAGGCWERCIVHWTVRESNFVKVPFFNGR